MNSELTMWVVQCLDGKEVPLELELACFRFVYYDLRHIDRYCEDDLWSDFALNCLPRIRRAIRSFRYQGKCFEAYLTTCIRFHYKTYLKTLAKDPERHLEFIPGLGYNLDHRAKYVAQTSPPDLLIPREKVKKYTDLPCFQRRLVIYVLKHSAFVGESFLAVLAKKTGLSFDWLLAKRNEVLTIILPLRDRSSQIIDKCTSALLELNSIHLKQVEARENYKDTGTLMARETLIRRRLRESIKKLNTIRLCPYHHELAEVLGVPKGTVDSSLFYLKNDWVKSQKLLKEILAEL